MLHRDKYCTLQQRMCSGSRKGRLYAAAKEYLYPSEIQGSENLTHC